MGVGRPGGGRALSTASSQDAPADFLTHDALDHYQSIDWTEVQEFQFVNDVAISRMRTSNIIIRMNRNLSTKRRETRRTRPAQSRNARTITISRRIESGNGVCVARFTHAEQRPPTKNDSSQANSISYPPHENENISDMFLRHDCISPYIRHRHGHVHPPRQVYH